MKKIIPIAILYTLFGCSQPEQKTTAKDTIPVENKSTAQSLEENRPTLSLPAGYKLDTIQEIDTVRKLEVSVTIPVSGINSIDKIVFEDIEKQKAEFIISLDEMIKEDNGRKSALNSSFYVHPFSVFKDNKVTSILFIVSYYHGGAAHPMTMYYSFNFDNNTQKRIFFADYFVIKNSADTSLLKDQIATATGRESIGDKALKDIDFNIEQDTISFNFDNYEIASYAEGIIQARMHRQELIGRINAKYR
jgi:Protein of unknown function (DUF3298)